MDRDKVISFVKGTLGCNCPDEVFEHIECLDGFMLAGDVELMYRMDIGNRLLVYVVRADGVGFVEDNLDRIFRSGIADRDTKGFNRFRLAVVTDDENIKAEAESVFESMEKDDKAHLHVVNIAQARL